MSAKDSGPEWALGKARRAPREGEPEGEDMATSRDTPAEKLILIVEDERDLADLLEYNLRGNGYRTISTHTGPDALSKARSLGPDLILLDLMIPELSGTEVARQVRADKTISQTPIIMLTAKSEEVDELIGLQVGADDYIPKPFSMKILMARVAALLRRAEPREGDPALDETHALGPVSINLSTHEAFVEGEPIRLTLTEFRVLATLIEGGGRVLSRGALIAKAIGPGITVTERTIDVHVTSIRKKLGPHAALIQTVRGVGYRASLKPESETE